MRYACVLARLDGAIMKNSIFYAGGNTQGVRSTSTSTSVRNQITTVLWYAPSQRHRDVVLRIVLTLVRTDDDCSLVSFSAEKLSIVFL